MRRASAFMTMAFLAGLGIAFFARSAGTGTLQRSDAHAADLAAIERLHRADIEAALTQDPSLLINLWSDDCVKLGLPGQLSWERKPCKRSMRNCGQTTRISRC